MNGRKKDKTVERNKGQQKRKLDKSEEKKKGSKRERTERMKKLWRKGERKYRR